MMDWLLAIGAFFASAAASTMHVAAEQTYLALTLVLLIEEAGVPLPVPGDTMILYAGYRIALGKVNPFLAVLCVMVATLLGSSVLYWLGRLGGHRLVFKYGKYVHLDERKLYRMERWYQEHQFSAIVLGRLVPGLRTATTVVAGIFEVPFSAYLAYTALSSLIWASIYLTAGALLGPKYDEMAAYAVALLGRPVVSGGLVLVVIAITAWLVVRRRPGWLSKRRWRQWRWAMERRARRRESERVG